MRDRRGMLAAGIGTGPGTGGGGALRPAQAQAPAAPPAAPALPHRRHVVRAPDGVVDVAMGRRAAEVVPGARLSVYDGVGHAPLREDAPRFNRELAELARSVRR